MEERTPVVIGQQPCARILSLLLRISYKYERIMTLSNQILRLRCQYAPLHETEFLDLSNLGLVIPERLASCPKLRSLILQGIKLQEAAGLDCCKQLWYLDLSNNLLESLEGLAQFLALGTLILSNNNLDWSALASIRHMHILSISLHGNPLLEKDPYYRIHVIDCLPNVWMLDGRIVTSAERIKIKHFFQDSALSKRPVRRKLKKNGFIPSDMKNINISGIFGDKAVQLMTSFPNNAVLNIETDKKRLLYLAQNIQEDINLEHRYISRCPAGHVQKQTLLLDALEARLNNRAQGNMLLLLLVASLEFILPTRLVKETLKKNYVLSSRQRSFQAMDLFLLPKIFRCRVASLLFSALKVDWDENEYSNLCPQLFLCLYHITQQLTKFNETTNYPVLKSTSKSHFQLHDYKRMLALQVVQMMYNTPVFFDFLADDVGVLNLVKFAVGDSDFVDKFIEVHKLSERSSTSGTLQETLHGRPANLWSKVHEQLQALTNKNAWLSACDRILCKSGALPMKEEASSVRKAEYLIRGATIPDDRPPSINPHKISPKVHSRVPCLGDAILLGPQTVGKILTIPQSTMALVLIDAVPVFQTVASGAVEHKLKKSDRHFAYVNIQHVEWENGLGMWRPLDIFCDEITTMAAINNFEESGQDDDLPASISCQETPRKQSLRSLIYCNRHSLGTPAVLPGKSKKTLHPRPATSGCKKLNIVHHVSRRVQSASPSTSCKRHIQTSKCAFLHITSAEMKVATTVPDEKIYTKLFEKTEENGTLITAEGLGDINSIPKTTSVVASVDLRSLEGQLADEYDPKDHTSLDKGTDTVRNVISGINTESQRGDDKNTEENEQARIPYNIS
ncbi:uncharacterized protein LOC112573414 isoform X2 [Pomacea canaliculata]|uniref:uncharacterized protein LOC112573414 isoform X2 n=1 Tax=Pomacea canaliculata TaxID=400727 RepID=UPI000D73A5AB|nr:uncharacterized protein LOC112573414 isoform X2 [Pomacea canaliculata]